ncbi:MULTISPECIES: Cfr10I/Bse634I family restriction endonuclease [Chromobacterium]|uniref:Cfr10I/Bse634I family restriction endonuclease n=1 Tax=Chromobacterium aquaticum TaxID=467180 RepID=A0ABV8ZX20_9NEIS|nr:MULTISPECIES: Cfr10I/Bse634I family restriction endonuclease [Chromobacterium]MCD5360506.1 Cfr10I/Bse634I family restriction endonuclease [Chromobacterium aquaticum]
MNRVKGRNTLFRFRQQAAMNCTFDAFMPGTDSDPDPTRTYETYLNTFRSNAEEAGRLLFGAAFNVQSSAIAKVEGDVFELLEAGAFWNAAAAWNRFMDSGQWSSSAYVCPEGAVATPTRKVAIVKLPRGYDATRLFKPEVRGSIQAFDHALHLRGMELGLSSPDIVGVRLPYPLPNAMKCFLDGVDSLNEQNLVFLEGAHRLLEDMIDGAGFLFAIAVKRTTRSDRLYQPLFEANILKYLIEFVLKGAAFRFYAHLNSFDGADVEGHYRAASLISLIRGGTPTKAVDSLYLALRPRDSAQSILNDLPLFPV